jgi:eukaryotic-like serine/threonine-protein kinase
MHYHPLSMIDWFMQEQLPLSILKLQMQMIARAVAYCHQCNIAHCDIKPANIMLRYDLSPVLIDFGMSNILGHTKVGCTGGTRSYQSPEIANKWSKMDNLELKRADCWSLGVTFY